MSAMLALPREIIALIIEQLTGRDLWNIYDCCHHLRACAARLLFRKATVRFDESTPILLNGRYFRSPRVGLLQTLSGWSHHVRTLDIWGDEAAIPGEFLDTLRGLNRLQTVRQVGDGGSFLAAI
ncbi:hypothetical protein CBS147347_11524 [Aspergillus niger]|nr:hypothetical protein CBS147347_11524 [Aspergillus niger]